MPIQASKKNSDPLQKKIPKNPRYADVLASVDSGSSLLRYLRKLDETSENFKIKPGEIFRRIKMTTFVQLVIQVAETDGPSGHQDDQFEEDNQVIDKPENTKKSVGVRDESNTSPKMRHTLESVIHGIGECDIKDKGQSLHILKTVEVAKCDCPYLLLDVRDRDEFDLCHIIRAISYPHTMLSRCMNFEIREMLAFRNKPGHIIVCYDEDESLAPRVATILTERGYDNIFLLSGGLKVAWKLFPKGLILGDAPATLKNRSGKRPRHEKNILRLSSASTSTPSICSGVSDDAASSVCCSSVGGRSVTSSVRRVVRYAYATYESVGSRGTPNGGEEFSMMDLAHLSLTLDGLFAAGRANGTANPRRNTTDSVCSRVSRVTAVRGLK